LRGEITQRGRLLWCDLPRGGEPVRIRDESGDIVATGEVGGYSYGDEVHISHFEVEDVPERETYTIEIGDLVDQPISLADLNAVDWMVELEAPCEL
jgi:hypothetical protein